MQKVIMSKNIADAIENSANEVLEALKEKLDNWQDLYDERESNEPEYDSQIDRWQEALDRLQEKIDELQDVIDKLEDWVSNLDLPHNKEENDSLEFGEADVEEAIEITNDMKLFNAEYRGIAPIIKKFEKEVDRRMRGAVVI